MMITKSMEVITTSYAQLYYRSFGTPSHVLILLSMDTKHIMRLDMDFKMTIPINKGLDSFTLFILLVTIAYRTNGMPFSVTYVMVHDSPGHDQIK